MRPDQINLRDPFVLKEDGKYYLYGTLHGNPSDRRLGFNVYISGDLKEFTEKRVFEPPDDFGDMINYWAPEVHKINGKFYMFATFCRQGGVRHSRILVSDAPDGQFVPFPRPLTPEDMFCLDATYFEERGKRYTVFCHEWVQCGDGEMILAELNGDLEIASPLKVLFRASDALWTKNFNGGKYITDGPYLHRMQNGKLLMLWSSAGADGYAMGMSVANRIEGPWEHLPVPLVSNDGGHGMLFRDGGSLILTYHAPNAPRGAERPIFREVTEEGNILKFAG